MKCCQQSACTFQDLTLQHMEQKYNKTGPHILDDDKEWLDADEEWLDAVNQMGVKIKLYTQAAQSPDLNINDLAFFRSIMSLYNEECPKNALKLIDAIKKKPMQTIRWKRLTECGSP